MAFYNSISIVFTDIAATTEVGEGLFTATSSIFTGLPSIYFITDKFSANASIIVGQLEYSTTTPTLTANNSINTIPEGAISVEESIISGILDISTVFQIECITPVITGVTQFGLTTYLDALIVDDSVLAGATSFGITTNLETILSYSGTFSAKTSLITESQPQNLAPSLSGVTSINAGVSEYSTIIDDSILIGASSISTTLNYYTSIAYVPFSSKTTINTDGVSSNYGTLTCDSSMSIGEGGLYIWNYYGTFLSNTDLSSVQGLEFDTNQNPLIAISSFDSNIQIGIITPTFSGITSLTAEDGFIGVYVYTPVFLADTSFVTTINQIETITSAIFGVNIIDSVFQIEFDTSSNEITGRGYVALDDNIPDPITEIVIVDLDDIIIVYETSTVQVKYKCYIDNVEYKISSWQARSQTHAYKTSYYVQCVIPSTDLIPSSTGNINISMYHVLPDGAEALAGQMVWAPVETVNRNYGAMNESITVQGSRTDTYGFYNSVSGMSHIADTPISRTEQNGTITTRLASLATILRPNTIVSVWGGAYLAQTISMYVSENGGAYTDIVGVGL